MKNKQNEANKYECVLCETGEGNRHGSLCSCNKSVLTEHEKELLKIIVEAEIKSFGNDKRLLSIEYQNILKKL